MDCQVTVSRDILVRSCMMRKAGGMCVRTGRAIMPPVCALSLGHRYCPFCGSDKVMRSRRRSLFEFVILPLLLLRPFRCHTRDARHYGFFFRKRATAGRAAGPEASPQSKSNSGCAK